MDRQPVDSTNIQSVGYDASAATLEIEFRAGTIYQYFGVPAQVHSELMAARSKGSYFNKHVKSRFRFTQIR